jgi:septation ring formation regulator EzrA
MVLSPNNSAIDPPQIFDGIGYQPPMTQEEEAFEQLQKLLVTPELSGVGPQLQAIQHQLQELRTIAIEEENGSVRREVANLKQYLEREIAAQSAVINSQLQQLRSTLKNLDVLDSEPSPDLLGAMAQTVTKLQAMERQLQSLQGLPTQLKQVQEYLAQINAPQETATTVPLEPKAFVKLLIPVLGELLNRKFQQFINNFNDGSISAIEECLEEKFNAFSERQTMLLKQEFSSIYRQMDQLDAKINYLSSYLEPRSKDN